jgi:hypothetical protein
MIAPAADDPTEDAPRPTSASERAVARLRPSARPRAGVLEGFVPIELASRGPRTLQASDRAPLPPARVIEAVESWADRETLFGDG